MQYFFSLIIFIGSVFGIPANEKPVVIVELFTSEGCSSCPPADLLLSEIVDNQYSDVDVIGLSFHVDYWDYIGWKDPYASNHFTQRQRTYARKFKSRQIYTPQMIVNGKHEFVGSDSKRWRHYLDQEKANISAISLQIENQRIVDNELTISVKSSQDYTSILNVAIVERGLSQEVNRGENRGKKLYHDNVVRVFTSRQFDGQPNTFKLDLPSDMSLGNASLVLYTQEEQSWEVLQAMKVDLKTID